MAATNINRVVMTGNLTRDPELRSLPSGMSVCSLRVACNTRRKNNSTGEWEDKPNYFDVTVWGAQGENCARFLAKGRPIAHRRAPRVARVGDAGGQQAPGRSTSSPTPCSSSAAARTAGRRRRRVHARAPTSRSTTRDFQPAGAPAGNGAPQRRGRRRHPVLERATPLAAAASGTPLAAPGVPAACAPTSYTLWPRLRVRAHSAAVSANSLLRARSSNSGEAAQPADAPA